MGYNAGRMEPFISCRRRYSHVLNKREAHASHNDYNSAYNGAFTIFQKKLVNENRHIREVNSKITGNFNEGITGAKTIKTLVIEDKIDRDFVDDTKEMKRSSVMAQRFRAILSTTIGFASSIALAIVIWKGGELSLIGSDAIGYMEIGTLSVFMSYALGIMEPIRWIVDMISDLVREQVNIERLTKLLETESDVTDTPEVIAKYGDTFSPKKKIGKNFTAI